MMPGVTPAPGDYLDAGIMAGLTVLPGPKWRVKSIAKSMAKRDSEEGKALASRSARMYNPKPLPQRSFEADHPNGATGDATGRLLVTMDGEPFTGAPVAGRTHVGGGDSGIPASAYESLATQAT